MEPTADLKSAEKSLIALARRLSDSDSIDPQTRRALQKATQKLSLSLETPADTLQRVSFLPLQAAVVRIALDLALFEKLEEAGPGGKSVHELEKDTGPDPALLTRILRSLAVSGVVDELGQDQFAATSVSKALLSPGAQAGVKHNYDFVARSIYKLPAYFAKTKYQNPTDATNGPFQYAFDTPLNGFAWIMQPDNAVLFQNFHTWLAASHEAHWLDWFPLKENVIEGLDRNEQAVTVVDVGGSLGHELLEIKKKYPELPGRLVLEDLPEIIKGVPETNVFEPTMHDFFTPQPVKNARVYYLRMILHDWPNDKARIILKNIIPAMRKGYSKLLINEMVIPSVGSGYREALYDWTMLACLSSLERDEKQWRSLLDSVGLEIVKIWSNPKTTESIIEAVPV